MLKDNDKGLRKINASFLISSVTLFLYSRYPHIEKWFRMNRLSAILCVMIFMLLTQECLAQPNLVLLKAGQHRHYYYQVGDRITYKDKLSDHKITGRISSLDDSSFQIAAAPRVKLSEVSTIYRTRHFLAQAAGAGVVVIGVFFPISVINRAIQHESPLINEDVMIVNGSMLAVSGISALFVVRKFHIGEEWRVKVMDFGHPVYD